MPQLKVTLVEARNLTAKDYLTTGKSDPYAVVMIGKSGERVNQTKAAKTAVVKANLNPSWNAEFLFDVADLSTQYLLIEVFDWNRLGNNTSLGHCEIALKDLVPGILLRDQWAPLVAGNRGEIRVLLQLLSGNEPKPVVIRSGWLNKDSGSKSFGGVAARRRWFVLTSDRFSWYKDPHGVETQQVTGSVPTTGLVFTKGPANEIKMVTQHKKAKTYTLIASSTRERDEWFEALTRSASSTATAPSQPHAATAAHTAPTTPAGAGVHPTAPAGAPQHGGPMPNAATPYGAPPTDPTMMVAGNDLELKKLFAPQVAPSDYFVMMPQLPCTMVDRAGRFAGMMYFTRQLLCFYSASSPAAPQGVRIIIPLTDVRSPIAPSPTSLKFGTPHQEFLFEDVPPQAVTDVLCYIQRYFAMLTQSYYYGGYQPQGAAQPVPAAAPPHHPGPAHMPVAGNVHTSAPTPGAPMPPTH